MDLKWKFVLSVLFDTVCAFVGPMLGAPRDLSLIVPAGVSFLWAAPELKEMAGIKTWRRYDIKSYLSVLGWIIAVVLATCVLVVVIGVIVIVLAVIFG